MKNDLVFRLRESFKRGYGEGYEKGIEHGVSLYAAAMFVAQIDEYHKTAEQVEKMQKRADRYLTFVADGVLNYGDLINNLREKGVNVDGFTEIKELKLKEVK